MLNVPSTAVPALLWKFGHDIYEFTLKKRVLGVKLTSLTRICIRAINNTMLPSITVLRQDKTMDVNLRKFVEMNE